MIRLGRRRALGEGETADEFLRVEFRRSDGQGLDLNPSVYQTNGSQQQLVQVHAEHVASLLQSPPRGAIHFDVGGLADHRARETPGATRFLYTRLHHKEIVFHEETLLGEFAARLHNEIAARRRSTALDELRAYIHAKLAWGDREWQLFAADQNTSADWRKLCTRAPRPST